MNIETIKNLLSKIKPGVFTRLTYQTELPLKAVYKKQGYRIVKIHSITTRFGIHYGNIKEVKEREASLSSEKTNNYNWIMKDNIQYNSNTDKYYLCTYPTKKGRNGSWRYVVYLPDGVSFEGLTAINKDWVQDSYWNKKSTNMMKINIDNVIKIGG